MPKVSVIMNCYNCASYLKEAIDSVYAQTYDDWEIVFWDNQSTDNSAKIANSYDSRLRYFKGQEFVPLATGRNLALTQADSEFVAFLDCDDTWLPDKLAKQMALFASRPELGLVYCDCYLVQANGERLKTYFSGYGKLAPARGYILDALLIESCFIPLLSVVARRQAILNVGGFNPDYSYAEDYDMWLRVAAEYLCDFVPEPLCNYRMHDSNLTVKYPEQSFTERLHVIEEWLDRPQISASTRTKLEENLLFTQFAYIFWLSKQSDRRREAFSRLQTMTHYPGKLLNVSLWKKMIDYKLGGLTS